MIAQETKHAWEDAARIITGGGVVIFPTDTVYGIGCDPRNPEAINRIFDLKSRSHLKALPLLLSDVAFVRKVSAQTNAAAEALGAAFWPGALTIVVSKDVALPVELGGGDTIALRVPAHSGLRSMIQLCGGAIAATSANLSGDPDALDAEQARQYFGSNVDLIIDGGESGGGVPSTVVNCVSNPPSILRPGAINALYIESVLRKAVSR